MNRPTLSIAPYYGGKGRMAHFICDRLDYENTDIFVTPFGGMCRVLLNKPRHAIECYNDFSSGLNALMTVLSDRVKSIEFIHTLYEKTEYSQQEFDRQKVIFDNAEVDLLEQERKKLRRLLIDEKIVKAVSANKFLDAIVERTLDTDNNSDKKYGKTIQSAFSELGNKLKRDDAFKLRFHHLLGNCIQLYQLKKDQGYIERSADMGEYVSDIGLAIATYVVFQQSRDGMGQVWSSAKFKSNDQYLQQILKLYDCAERLAGVHVYQIDAIDFFREFMFYGKDPLKTDIDDSYLVINSWIKNPRVMMYCDPSYISPDDEEKLLEGIDADKENCLSDAILKKHNGKLPKNLGKIYARSFGYDDQEAFLRCIQNARCKMMVSNYDLKLYNKYLNEKTGWRREEFYTTTSVGGKKDNSRVEVIWYNY